MRRTGTIALSLVLVTLAGCKAFSSQPRERTADEQAMFGPVSMRIHPTFTQVKDWTGDGKPDGVEALLEFTDRFGDPAKTAGTVLFELYDYRRGWPDPKGERVVNPWSGSLVTYAEQQAHWEKAAGAYSFRLAYDGIRADRAYVLTATFEPSDGKRFFAQTVLEPRTPEPGAPATMPTTVPDGGPPRRTPEP